MERVPALKKIIDHYSGPDRVTAMKQNAELEKVAKTLPKNVPDSIKRFTDRAVLSLQVSFFLLQLFIIFNAFTLCFHDAILSNLFSLCCWQFLMSLNFELQFLD